MAANPVFVGHDRLSATQGGLLTELREVFVSSHEKLARARPDSEDAVEAITSYSREVYFLLDKWRQALVCEIQVADARY